MLPVGSDNAQVNSSNLATADMTPPDALFDDDNPLQFPPWDNSTGTLVTYVPSNNSIDGNLTNQFEAADCTFARDHGAQGYHQSCQTRFPGGQSMQVRITISGTGYAHQHLPALEFVSISNMETARKPAAGARVLWTTCTSR